MLKTDPSSVMYVELIKKVLTASIYEESAWKIKEKKSGLGRYFLRLLKKRSLVIVKQRPLDLKKRESGEDWPMFGYTMTGHKRLNVLQDCIEKIIAENTPGDFVETGVWRGGSSIFMKALLNLHEVKQKKLWLADSFEGMPIPKDAADGWDYSDTDYLSVSLEQVKSNFEKFDLLDENVHFLKGWFSDTLPDAPISDISLLRLDGDLYSSTMDSLVNLYHKVVPGGFVIVDDYFSWPACKQAVTDYLQSHGLNPTIHQIDGTGAFWRVEK